MPDLAGVMRHRVEIWRQEATDGALGRRLGPPVLVATVWASIRPDRGTTAHEGQVAVDRCDLIVTMRAHAAVRELTGDHVLRIQGQSYRMRSIEPANPLTGRRTVYCVREAPGRLP
jgi:head-tail adaptor